MGTEVRAADRGNCRSYIGEIDIENQNLSREQRNHIFVIALLPALIMHSCVSASWPAEDAVAAFADMLQNPLVA